MAPDLNTKRRITAVAIGSQALGFSAQTTILRLGPMFMKHNSNNQTSWNASQWLKNGERHVSLEPRSFKTSRISFAIEHYQSPNWRQTTDLYGDKNLGTVLIIVKLLTKHSSLSRGVAHFPFPNRFLSIHTHTHPLRLVLMLMPFSLIGCAGVSVCQRLGRRTTAVFSYIKSNYLQYYQEKSR